MKVAWRFHIKAIIFQPLIEFVDLLFAFLDKADMKARRIPNFCFSATWHERENKVVITKQHNYIVVTFKCCPKSEVYF